MTNRTGKNEREARRRRKRSLVILTPRGGPELPPVKLGRKKSMRMLGATWGDKPFACAWLSRSSYPSHGMRPAVPVTDSRKAAAIMPEER